MLSPMAGVAVRIGKFIAMSAEHHSRSSNFIWSIVKLLCGPRRRNGCLMIMQPLGGRRLCVGGQSTSILNHWSRGFSPCVISFEVLLNCGIATATLGQKARFCLDPRPFAAFACPQPKEVAA